MFSTKRNTAAQTEETMVRTYTSTGAQQKDAKKLARQGWRVAHVASHNRRSGVGRVVLTGGIGAIAFRPKPEIIVTYARSVAHQGGYDHHQPGNTEAVTCPRCGTETPLSARFCPGCGLQRTQAPRY